MEQLTLAREGAKTDQVHRSQRTRSSLIQVNPTALGYLCSQSEMRAAVNAGGGGNPTPSPTELHCTALHEALGDLQDISSGVQMAGDVNPVTTNTRDPASWKQRVSSEVFSRPGAVSTSCGTSCCTSCGTSCRTTCSTTCSTSWHRVPPAEP